MNQATVHRILIVDDNKAIHEDLRKVLSADEPTALDAAEACLFDGPAPVTGGAYELDFASQGQEALAKVCAALEAGRPFSMAFVDMRMPPGWDGVETIAHIWEKDQDIQIVLCTAYSDYSWQQILQKLGRSDRLLILKKPFDTVEACQLACALTRKWTLAREAGIKKAELELLVRELRTELAKADEAPHRANQPLHAFYEIESERNHATFAKDVRGVGNVSQPTSGSASRASSAA